MFKGKKSYKLDEPIPHADHPRPRTRREFIAQGFHAGMGSVLGASTLSLMAGSATGAEVSAELSDKIRNFCEISGGNRKIPFICFDLAGGANMAGSNVLVGGPGGQLDFLSTAGYAKQGIPGDMVPGLPEATPTATSNGDHTDSTLGLVFHSDSQMLAGMLERTAVATRANVNGAVIAARSENDTGNNPHNPMYAINLAGAKGELLSLIGSRTSESGGNSLAPMQFINPEVRPTKVDRPSDVNGLVSAGSFGLDLSEQQIVDVMEYVSKVSDHKIGSHSAYLSLDAEVQKSLECVYAETANLAAQYPPTISLDPNDDPDIVGDTGIFTVDEMDDREFRKTASIMKLVLDSPENGYPYAGAGTITMGGYDYHTGDRSTGEQRDLRAGRCMGACLEYAARKGRPLMMYVYSDGSVFSNGMTDDTVGGRGKGVWTGDNQQTAAAFFLVYNPTGRPLTTSVGNQIGWMRPSGDVETSSSPAANNVNQLVQMLLLNYMGLHGDVSRFESLFTNNNLVQGLGSGALLDNYVAFQQITTAVNEAGEGIIS